MNAYKTQPKIIQNKGSQVYMDPVRKVSLDFFVDPIPIALKRKVDEIIREGQSQDLIRQYKNLYDDVNKMDHSPELYNNILLGRSPLGMITRNRDRFDDIEQVRTGRPTQRITESVPVFYRCGEIVADYKN